MADSEGLSGAEWRRAWRIITLAGFLGSTYYLLCVSGAPRLRYLTELDATPFDFGLISSLGTFVLAFQVIGSMLGNRVRHRKVLWLCLALTHRLLFLGVLLAPLLSANPRFRIAWIILFLFCHDSIAQVTVPIWFSWMADLVPKESMSRHWASRLRIITAATIFVMVLIAVGFDHFEDTGRVILGFSILGCLGVAIGTIDILLFLRVPEPPHERVENVPWGQVLLQPLRDRDFRRFLVFMGYWHFAAYLAAPFFGLYVLDELEYSALTVQMLGVAGALGVVVSSRFWGLVCDVYGFRPVLQMLSVAKIFTPTAFVLAPQTPGLGIAYFSVVWFVDGVINAGLALAFQGPLLKFTPRRNRTMYIAAAYFLAIGTMASIAPVFSGYLIKTVNALESPYGWLAGVNGYHIAFGMSVIFGAAAFPLAGRIIEPTAGPLGTVIAQVFSLNSLRVPKWTYRLRDGRREADRVRAAKILGALRNPMAVGELINALHDDSHAVRDAAAEALGEMGSSDAIKPLVDALFDTGSGIQPPAARALGQIGGIDSLRALLRYLQSRNAEALADTVDALARIGDDAALLPLILLFNEAEDEALRRRAAGALATLSRSDSLEEVVEMLSARRPFSQQLIK